MTFSVRLKKWLTLLSPLLCARHSLTHTLAHFTFINRTIKMPEGTETGGRGAGVLSDFAFPRLDILALRQTVLVTLLP